MEAERKAKPDLARSKAKPVEQLREALRELQANTTGELFDVKSRLLELERRLAALERADARAAKPSREPY